MHPDPIRLPLRPATAGASPAPAADVEPLLDTPAVAKILGIHPRSVDNLRKAGKLTSRLIGRLRRYAPADVQAFIDASKD